MMKTVMTAALVAVLAASPVLACDGAGAGASAGGDAGASAGASDNGAASNNVNDYFKQNPKK